MITGIAKKKYEVAKMKIYILDDGTRKEFASFATEANVGYITRTKRSVARPPARI